MNYRESDDSVPGADWQIKLEAGGWFRKRRRGSRLYKRAAPQVDQEDMGRQKARGWKDRKRQPMG